MRKKLLVSERLSFIPMTELEIKEQYKKIFDILNHKYFEGVLPNIEILPCLNNKDHDCLAYFSMCPDKKKPPVIVLQCDSIPEYGINTDDINDLFHELIHYYCYIKNIEDVKKDNISYHTIEFKKQVEIHGGSCNYTDEINGYNDAHLSKNELENIFYSL